MRVYARPIWHPEYDRLSHRLPERLWQVGTVTHFGRYKDSFKYTGMDSRWLKFLWSGKLLREILPEVGLDLAACDRMGVVGVVANVRNEFVGHFLRTH